MTDEEILRREHEAIKELCLSDSADLDQSWKDYIIGYIDGINTFAELLLTRKEEDLW